MNRNGFAGMGGLDPSKMSPEVIAELSGLMRTLTPDQMMRMQTLMHNVMAGHDVSAEMAVFEQSLPPGFRERMARIMYMAHGVDLGGSTGAPAPAVEAQAPTNIHEARKVVLQAVARGEMQPDEAMRILFPEG